MEFVLSFVGSLVLAGFHALTPLLDRAPARHAAVLASASGGASLAYVVLYLLFELTTEGAETIHALAPLGPAPVETVLLLLLLAISLTHVVQLHLEKTADLRDDHHGLALLFILYNLLAGGGVVEEATWGAVNLAFYLVAIGLHLLFNDRFLGHLCPAAHTPRWRAALAAAPVLGWAVTAAVTPPPAVQYVMLALVAGGTIMNVLRRELPDPQALRPLAFLGGVSAYAALIFATWRF